MIESGSLLNAARRSRIGPTADCGGCWSTASSAPRHQGCPAGSAPTSVLASGNRIGASPGNRHACAIASIEPSRPRDRKRDVSGKSVSVRVYLGGRLILKKTNTNIIIVDLLLIHVNLH